ncbi:hypothetical protein [Streptomyces enissocaesilis]|uniref:Secreted protein n=1 Tax=Streptomyces enissocaesilis TaxID=332589 RepID=A0ABN3XA38_9ACTN
MPRTASRATTVVTACAAAAGLTLTIAATSPAAVQPDRTAATAHHTPAVRTTPTAEPAPDKRWTAAEIHRFLAGFYGKHGPSPWEREHQVAPGLKERAAGIPDYDLLLCAQNEPRNISIGKVTTAQSARVGWATVTTHWGANDKQRFTAYVDLDAEKPIKLLDVACRL